MRISLKGLHYRNQSMNSFESDILFVSYTLVGLSRVPV